ncbi:hypothetical protein [Haloechinothrix salitolerans]|uniref:Uncharacterized protein n=1 Tax=Haloechinothrix salitolerans TaxID=926830 RepID=A0ABW2C5P8_9PSEU
MSVGDVVGHVPRADGEERFGVGAEQHPHGRSDRAEHGRVGGGVVGRHRLLEQVQQSRDVAACGLEVARLVGCGDFVVVEGERGEGARRVREAPLGSQLARARDGVADDRLDLLVRQAQDPGSNGATAVTASDCAATASAKVPLPDQPPARLPE